MPAVRTYRLSLIVHLDNVPEQRRSERANAMVATAMNTVAEAIEGDDRSIDADVDGRTSSLGGAMWQISTTFKAATTPEALAALADEVKRQVTMGGYPGDSLRVTTGRGRSFRVVPLS